MLRAAKHDAVWHPNKNRTVDDRLSAHQNFLTLQRAMMSRAMLEVRMPDDDKVYQSVILELDSDEGTMLIDELFPCSYEGAPGQWVDIIVRQAGGRCVRFGTTILQHFTYDDAPIYVLALPEDLDQDQRRGAFRLPIDSGIVVESNFVGPDRCEYLGQLHNISSSGLCLVTDADDAVAVKYNDMLKNIAFEYGGMQVECCAKVKNITEDENSRYPIQIGAQFQNMSLSERRQLERLILKMQRTQLRSKNQEYGGLVH